jgi:hypothetical protein
MKTNYQMTYVVNFTHVQGNISVEKYLELVKSGFVRSIIEKVRDAVSRGDSDEAAKLKKMLAATTPSGLYDKGRNKSSFLQHTGLICLDLDHLAASLQQVRDKIEHDPHTLLCNLSPSGDGLKVLVPVLMANANPPNEWNEAVSFHEAAYRLVSKYYMEMLNVEIDTSGKDITRLCFLSYDPQAMMNSEAEAFVVQPSDITTKPEKTKDAPTTDKKKKPNKGEENLHNLLSTDTSHDRLCAMFLIICKNLHEGGKRFEQNNRNNFLFQAVCRMNDFGIPQSNATKAVFDSMETLYSADFFNNLHTDKESLKPIERLDTDELNGIINSVYSTHKDKFGSCKLGKAIMLRIFMQDYIKRNFIMRRNVLSQKLEYIYRMAYEQNDRQFHDVDDNILNYISGRLSEYCRDVPYQDLVRLIMSPFIPLYDPVKSYLSTLPKWDGVDHIANLCNSVETNAPDRFIKIMKMFLVGMINCYLKKKEPNHIVPVLYSGGEGAGKTWFIKQLLPPELLGALYDGTIKDEKDSLHNVASNLLISINELNHIKKDDVMFLKEIITHTEIEYRPPYERFTRRCFHNASFIASANDTHFMSDPAGNRRFHVFETRNFDMDYVIDHKQFYAQIMSLIDSGFKYWFTPKEQDELSAYSYQFEHNSEEYDYVLKYLRQYTPHCQHKESHSLLEIANWIKKFNVDYIIDRASKSRLARALARRGFESKRTHSGNQYFCYLLNAEQWGYIEQARNPDVLMDLDYDKLVPREILIAGTDAKIEDIRKAKGILGDVHNDFEKAQSEYSKYITKDKNISNINFDDLPF